MILELLSVGGTVLVVAPIVAFHHTASVARVDTVRIKHMDRWRREFHEQASLLIGAEALPQARLEQVRKWGNWISDPSLVSILLAAIPDTDPVEIPRAKAELMEAIEESDFYMQTYVRMMLAAFMAISFQDAKLGPVIRDRLAETLAIGSKKEAVARVVEFIPRDHEGCGDDGSFAVAA